MLYNLISYSLCDGRVLITGCSGLAIISAFPIKHSEFHEYYWKGTIWDGEALAGKNEWKIERKIKNVFIYFALLGKGVGRVQIQPQANLTVDLFVTHTIADSGTTMANNSWYRIKQVEELMDKHVKQSKADAIILGGDFNVSLDAKKLNMGNKIILQKLLKLFL